MGVGVPGVTFVLFAFFLLVRGYSSGFSLELWIAGTCVPGHRGWLEGEEVPWEASGRAALSGSVSSDSVDTFVCHPAGGGG